MQIKALPATLLFVGLCFPAGAAAGPAPADFLNCSDVRRAVKAEGLYQVHLTAEVLGQAAPVLNDLRLFDGAGKETPFTVIENVPPYEETPGSYTMEVTAYETGPSSAVITMKLPEKYRPISLLDLDITARDFKKRVVLSASRDGKNWQRLAEDSIYDFTSQVDLRKTRIEFARTDARFFRIELAEAMPQAASPQSMTLKYEGLEFNVNGAGQKALRIRAATGHTLVPAEKKPLYDEKDFSDLAPVQDKDGNTVIVLPASLPVDRLLFHVNDRYYYRTVNVYGSATGKEDSFQFVASRQIYRFPLSLEQQEEQNQMDIQEKYAYYKLVVLNKSNLPLGIPKITVFWIRKNLYFMAGSNTDYALCFGNHRMTRPDYDIMRFVDRTSLARFSVQQATLAAPVRNGAATRTLRERVSGMEKPVLRIVVVLLVIGMGGWLFSLLTKSQKQK